MADDLADALAPILRARPDIEVGMLFGSAARAKLRPDSDVDLYVRMRQGVRLDAARRDALESAAERVCRREIDLVVETPETSVILRREVAATGRLLYEAWPGAWTDLRAEAVMAYIDLEPYLPRMGDAVRAAVRRRGAAPETQPDRTS